MAWPRRVGILQRCLRRTREPSAVMSMCEQAIAKVEKDHQLHCVAMETNFQLEKKALQEEEARTGTLTPWPPCLPRPSQGINIITLPAQ